MNTESSEPQGHIEIEGVRFFGRDSGPVTPEEITAIAVPLESTLHIIRHLKSVDAVTKQHLIGQHASTGNKELVVTPEYIQAQLQSTGSKFNPKISNPDQLIRFGLEKFHQVVNTGNVRWLAQNDHEEARVHIVADEADKKQLGLLPDEYLGTHSIIELTPELLAQTKQVLRGQGEARDQVLVNVLENHPIPETDDMIIVIERQLGHDARLKTMYTGTVSPSLPRAEEQSPEEFAYNQDFWGRYAFIK